MINSQTKAPSNIDIEIDKILIKFATHVYSSAPDFYLGEGEIYDGLDQDQSKYQIKQLINSIVLELIGEYDRDYSHDNADEESLRILVACSNACNELRTEQRLSLKDKLQ